MSADDQSLYAGILKDRIQKLAEAAERDLRFMEVCGTHTMAIHSSGLKSMLPGNIKLVSGPGCPVCVTEKSFIDEAISMGNEHGVVLITFGDLIRVPGSDGSLSDFRAKGGEVRVVYSPLDAIRVASEIKPKPAVFLGVGFETTIPTVAAAVKAAKQKGIDNLFVLTAFKTIHPPLKILARQSDLTGFLLPGHVSAILGANEFEYLSIDFGKPGVVAGFEPLDILSALEDLVRMAVLGSPSIVNGYKRVVRNEGNPAAKALMHEVFEPSDAKWRGLGTIPGSGLAFRQDYLSFDARRGFPVQVQEAKDDPRCLCAAILTGVKLPVNCGLFGKECTPEEPVGPCMVSSEGTCAAYYKYGAA